MIMEKLNLIIKLSFKFFAKYINDYIKATIKLVVLCILGFALVPLSYFGIPFALLTFFVTIPLFCYCFWRGYVITYALNYLAFEFLKKQEQKTFKECVDTSLKNGGELAKYVSFIAVITILGYIPFIYYFIHTTSLTALITDPMGLLNNLGLGLIFMINTLFLAPFINFALQAYFFKKNESYMDLLKNCYKYLDITGILITLIIVGFTTIISSAAVVIYALIFLPLNVIIYSVNTFWYYSRLKEIRR